MGRVVTSTLNKLIKNNVSVTTIALGKLDDNEIKMDVKKTLTTKEFLSFVAEMKNTQFSGDEFEPQFESVIFDVKLCEYYTNLNLPKGLEEQYQTIHALNIKDKILEVIGNTEQYASLLSCLHEHHEYLKLQKTGLNGLLSSLTSGLGGVDLQKALEMLGNSDITESTSANLTSAPLSSTPEGVVQMFPSTEDSANANI